MPYLKMLVIVLVALGATSFLAGQESESSEQQETKTLLDQAIEASQKTGKPIFAVAGRST